MLLFFFFFKQKTAYEMRISDWSSDVCSSDLLRRQARVVMAVVGPVGQRPAFAGEVQQQVEGQRAGGRAEQVPLQAIEGGQGLVGAGDLVDLPRQRQAGHERMAPGVVADSVPVGQDRKSTRLNSSH